MAWPWSVHLTSASLELSDDGEIESSDMMRHLMILVTVTLGLLVRSEESDQLVITVGELVQMVNSEDGEVTGKTENNTREGKEISDDEIKVDFNSVVGENQMFCAKSTIMVNRLKMLLRRKDVLRKWCCRKRRSMTERFSVITGQ